MTDQSPAKDFNQLAPLAGVRVLELSDGKCEMCGRYLADLGADVVLLEPPGGAPSRRNQPLHHGASLHFAAHNANKRSVVADLATPEGRERFLRLADAADILIETTRPGTLEGLGIGVPKLHERNPGLVVLSITDFGQTGPWRDYVGTNAVQLAMAGTLCRSGLPGSEVEPLLPPGALAYECSAAQAAWTVLLSFWQRGRIGVGDHLDFSVFEGTAQIIDPIAGATGSAAAGRSVADLAATHGRPDVGHLYPIFKCRDGYVRMCILNPRQWDGMSKWLGPDHEFSDPSWGNLFKRMQRARDVNRLISQMTANLSALEAVTEGQKRGIPVAVLASPSQVLGDPHFNARGAFTSIEIAAGAAGKVPSGFVEVDGARAGIRRPAPSIGQHEAEVLAQWQPRQAPGVKFSTGSSRRPLAGVRVLDLGVIIAGAELGRILADQGAEVIKVENRAFPDGGRQSDQPTRVSFSFAQGHRNKQSLGLNLRSAQGVAIFKELARRSDVVLSNFKPGTMESLGIGYDVLSQINPRIVCAESSALGNTGPLAKSMGYGPLVRASTGLTGLWCYPDRPGSFCDAITIVPDHYVARVSAAGVMALLLRRERTGRGGLLAVSQAESILTALSTELLRESVDPGSTRPRGNDGEFEAPDGVFPCAGDDEWCVVALRGDGDWPRLCKAIGRDDLLADARLSTSAGRVQQRALVNAAVKDWTARRSPDEAMAALQAVGVPAGKMFRLDEFERMEHLRGRHFYRTLQQTGYDEIWPTENAPVRSLNMPDPDIRPAPRQGQHTREVMARVLGTDTAEIQRLIDAGDLEILVEPAPAA
ncbi:MAG: CaiB/BaiF CoA transferase family protein [Gammaproteobacteria bacterium]